MVATAVFSALDLGFCIWSGFLDILLIIRQWPTLFDHLVQPVVRISNVGLYSMSSLFAGSKTNTRRINNAEVCLSNSVHSSSSSPLFAAITDTAHAQLTLSV